LDSSRERSLARLPAQDVAYELLRQTQAPMSFHDLMSEVLRIKDVPAERRRRAMAEINTEINLDPRFQYLGNARWGLREWAEHAPEVPSQLGDDESSGEGDDDEGMGEEE
jgi:DNA-directed RNA polymerase subunit delta